MKIDAAVHSFSETLHIYKHKNSQFHLCHLSKIHAVKRYLYHGFRFSGAIETLRRVEEIQITPFNFMQRIFVLAIFLSHHGLI